MSKNITYKNGGLAKVGDEVEVIEKRRDGDVKRKAILLAVNAETPKANGRIVFVDTIHVLPAVDINLLFGPGSAVEPGVDEGGTQAGGAGGEGELRQDGPTLVEYVQADRDPKTYPPKGYAAKTTDDPLEVELRAAMAGGHKADVNKAVAAIKKAAKAGAE